MKSKSLTLLIWRWSRVIVARSRWAAARSACKVCSNSWTRSSRLSLNQEKPKKKSWKNDRLTPFLCFFTFRFQRKKGSYFNHRSPPFGIQKITFKQFWMDVCVPRCPLRSWSLILWKFQTIWKNVMSRDPTAIASPSSYGCFWILEFEVSVKFHGL